MYKFIPDDVHTNSTSLHKYRKNNRDLFELVKIRDKLVIELKEIKQGIKYLRKSNLNIVISCLQRKLCYTKIKVSYINYILDLNRVDIPEDKKKPSYIKSFNSCEYNYCSNKPIIEVNKLLNNICPNIKGVSND
jgi:hypothetical protein